MSAQRDPFLGAARRSSRSSHSSRHAPRWALWVANGWPVRAAAKAVFALLAIGMLGVLPIAASCASSAATSSSGAGAGSDATRAAETTTAPAGGDAWIPLRSRAPADILAAARSGQLFRDSQANGGEGAPDLSRLGAPVFVQALRPAGITADELPDFYVVPALNAAGDATDAIELALNSTVTAAQEIAIVTYSEPRAGGAISVLTQAQAIQMVASQRHMAVSAIGHPSLVYFALDPQWQGSQNGQVGWTGGGALPADPIWLVPADGGSYLAGNDGAVYTVSQLPQAAPQ